MEDNEEEVDIDIPAWNKEYGKESFLEYFTTSLCGIVYLGLMHAKEVTPHIPLVEIIDLN